MSAVLPVRQSLNTTCSLCIFTDHRVGRIVYLLYRLICIFYSFRQNIFVIVLKLLIVVRRGSNTWTQIIYSTTF